MMVPAASNLDASIAAAACVGGSGGGLGATIFDVSYLSNAAPRMDHMKLEMVSAV